MHEAYQTQEFRLTYDFNKDELIYCLMDMLGHNVPIMSDVGWYWLNYVPHILGYHRETKFICLKRDKTQTINSFVNYPPTKATEDSFFYKIRKSLPEYYDKYYEVAENFERLYPDLFRIFDINTLNSYDGQNSILDFVGFEQPKQFQLPLHFHANGGKEGKNG